MNRLAESVLVTGANRGIGLELVKQLSSVNPSPKIFAVCRNPNDAELLQAVVAERPSISVLRLSDVRDYNSYETLVNQVKSKVGESRGLNVLINNAAISVENQNLTSTTPEQMMTTYEVNTVAPLFLTRAFLPLLKDASNANSSIGLSCARAAVINVTSRMGSIADNGMGAFYSYRASKAALNMVTKSLSIDLKPSNILVTCIHPGWVLTDMGGPNAQMTVQDSVREIVQTLFRLGESNNGEFLNFDGSSIPW